MHFATLSQDASDASALRTLGLEEGASCKAVREAFLQRARETHPDKGGSPEVFLRVKDAYARLLEDGRGDRAATSCNFSDLFSQQQGEDPLPADYFRRVTCLRCLGTGRVCETVVDAHATHVKHVSCEACEGRGFFSSQE